MRAQSVDLLNSPPQVERHRAEIRQRPLRANAVADRDDLTAGRMLRQAQA